MLQLVKKIADKRGSAADLEKIKEIGSAMKRGALCGLGQTAPNPVLSTIKFFKEEYDALIQEAETKRQAQQKLKGEMKQLEAQMNALNKEG